MTYDMKNEKKKQKQQQQKKKHSRRIEVAKFTDAA